MKTVYLFLSLAVLAQAQKASPSRPITTPGSPNTNPINTNPNNPNINTNPNTNTINQGLNTPAPCFPLRQGCAG